MRFSRVAHLEDSGSFVGGKTGEQVLTVGSCGSFTLLQWTGFFVNVCRLADSKGEHGALKHSDGR